MTIPAALAVFFTVLAIANATGDAGAGALIPVFLAPAILGLVATAVLAGWVAKTSDSAIAAAPVVLGCGGGVLLSIFLASFAPESVATLGAFAVLPAAGAFAGTLLPWRAAPIYVGLLMGGLAVIFGILRN